jgi:hypothetical protein
MASARHDYGSVNPPFEVTPGQWLALITAIAFTAAGIAGFILTGFSDFAAHHHQESLLGFHVNPLHNLVHLALGIPGLFLWRRIGTSRAYGILVAAAYLPAFIYGLFAVGETWDFLALNDADNWLHLGFTILGVAIAALSVRRTTGDRARDRGAAAA